MWSDMVLMKNNDLQRGRRGRRRGRGSSGADEKDICVRYDLHERVIKGDKY